MRNGGVKSPPIFAKKWAIGGRAPSKVDGCTEQPFFGVE